MSSWVVIESVPLLAELATFIVESFILFFDAFLIVQDPVENLLWMCRQ